MVLTVKNFFGENFVFDQSGKLTIDLQDLKDENGNLYLKDSIEILNLLAGEPVNFTEGSLENDNVSFVLENFSFEQRQYDPYFIYYFFQALESKSYTIVFSPSYTWDEYANGVFDDHYFFPEIFDRKTGNSITGTEYRYTYPPEVEGEPITFEYKYGFYAEAEREYALKMRSSKNRPINLQIREKNNNDSEFITPQ